MRSGLKYSFESNKYIHMFKMVIKLATMRMLILRERPEWTEKGNGKRFEELHATRLEFRKAMNKDRLEVLEET